MVKKKENGSQMAFSGHLSDFSASHRTNFLLGNSKSPLRGLSFPISSRRLKKAHLYQGKAIATLILHGVLRPVKVCSADLFEVAHAVSGFVSLSLHLYLSIFSYETADVLKGPKP